MLLTQMFPLVMLVAPIFKMLAPLGLTNSLTGLIIVYTAFNVPFATFLMQSFFDGIPKELEEAAMIDGATRFRRFRQIILPLTLPGIAATLGFVFTAAWSELLFALMLISGDEKTTFPVGLLTFVSQILGRLRADDGGRRAGADPGLPLLPAHPALSRAGPDGRRGQGLAAWPSIDIRNVRKSFGTVPVLHGRRPRDRGRRVRRAGRPLRLRQVHAAAHDRRARGGHRRRDPHRRHAWSTTCAPKDRDIAMVFQSYALYPHMNVADNMSYSLRLSEAAEGDDRRGGRQRRRQARPRQPLLERRPQALSGGQRQRVAMGRAIVRAAQGLPVRRAALQPRRPAARADARRDQASCTASSAPPRSTSPTTRSRR